MPCFDPTPTDRPRLVFLPEDRPAAVRDARALVADPARAEAGGAQLRLMAWAVLMGERGSWLAQHRLIQDQSARGMRP